MQERWKRLVLSVHDGDGGLNAHALSTMQTVLDELTMDIKREPAAEVVYFYQVAALTLFIIAEVPAEKQLIPEVLMQLRQLIAFYWECYYRPDFDTRQKLFFFNVVTTLHTKLQQAEFDNNFDWKKHQK